MTHKTQNYNLLVEDWIPILRTDGKPDRVGIKQALLEAGHIRQIAASNPMDRVAILRFLLALLYWCNGNPSNDVSAKLNDSFPAHWFAKLEKHQECFNLLGEPTRFYQCAPSASSRSPAKLSANYLIQEIPTGTNKWHFRHSTDEVDGLCQSCCAMGLLRLPAFATSGGRGKPPGVNAKPPFYVIPSGMSLAATLRLSWRPVSNLGMPAWEKPDFSLPTTGQVPFLVGLTWLPRRVWLDDPEESETACISCGQIDRLVRMCVFEGIGSTRTDEGGMGRVWRDPHVIYVGTSRGDDTPLRVSDALGASDAAAGQWATIIAGMLRDERAINSLRQAMHASDAENSNVRTWIVGFSTVQNDKYLEAMELLLSFPLWSHQLTQILERIERWQKETRRMKTLIGRSKLEGAAATAAIRPVIEAKVSAKLGELFNSADVAWEGASNEYRPIMRAMGKSLSPGFTTVAVQRRKRIAGLAPDMRLAAEPTKKTRPKKGDEQ